MDGAGGTNELLSRLNEQLERLVGGVGGLTGVGHPVCHALPLAI